MLEQEKTEAATPRRRQKAREKGEVARSLDLATSLLLLAGFLLLSFLVRPIAQVILELSQSIFTGPVQLSVSVDSYPQELSQLAFYLLRRLFLFFAVLVLMGLGVHLFQTGWMFHPEKLSPDPGRLDPQQGLSRIFSWDGLIRTLSGSIKIVLCLFVWGWTCWSQRAGILSSESMEVGQFAEYSTQFLLSLGLRIGAVLLLFSVGDFLYQRWKYERDLRMTPEEIKEEMKETLGDPQTRQYRQKMNHS